MRRKILFLAALLLSVCLVGCSSGESKKDLGVSILDMTASDFASRGYNYFTDFFNEKDIKHEGSVGGAGYSLTTHTVSSCFGSDAMFYVSNIDSYRKTENYVALKSKKEVKNWDSFMKKYCDSKQLKGFYNGETEDNTTVYIIDVEDYPEYQWGSVKDGVRCYKVIEIYAPTEEEEIKQWVSGFPMDNEYMGYRFVSCNYVGSSEFTLKNRYAEYVDSFEADIYPVNYEFFQTNANWTLNGKKYDSLTDELDKDEIAHVKAKKKNGEMFYEITTK